MSKKTTKKYTPKPKELKVKRKKTNLILKKPENSRLQKT
jgi:hypothetical protein